MNIHTRPDAPAIATEASSTTRITEANATRRDAPSESSSSTEGVVEAGVHLSVSAAAAARLAEAEEQRADVGKLERLRAATHGGALAIDSARIARRMLPGDEGDAS